MRRLWTGTAALALAAALIAAPAASGQEQGEIGGPPSNPFVALPKGKAKAKRFGLPRALGPAIVFGVTRTTAGRVELVAQNSTKGVCVSSTDPDGFDILGTCTRSQPPVAIRPVGWSVIQTPKRVYGTIAGFVKPGTPSVSVAIEHRGKRKIVSPAVATPDASILARLGASEPFSWFHTDFGGCVAPHKTIVQAFDSAGTVIERERGPRIYWSRRNCRRTPPHTSTGLTVYADDINVILFDSR